MYRNKVLIAMTLTATIAGCSSLEPWEPEFDPATQPAVEMVSVHAFLNVCVVSASLKLSPRNVMNANRIMKSDAYVYGEEYVEYDEDTVILLNQRLSTYKSDTKKFTNPEDLPPRTIEIRAKGGSATIESGFNTLYWCAIDMQGGNPNQVISILLDYFEKADETFTISEKTEDSSQIVGLLDNKSVKVEDVIITMQAKRVNGTPALLVTAMPSSIGPK